jgi:hypothetical protein
MKKSIFILSICLGLGIISCEKDEFQDGQLCDGDVAANRLGDSLNDENALINKSNKFDTDGGEQITVYREDLLIGVDEKPLIQIKEVSDGDDEADDGDDSKTSN